MEKIGRIVGSVFNLRSMALMKHKDVNHYASIASVGLKIDRRDFATSRVKKKRVKHSLSDLI